MEKTKPDPFCTSKGISFGIALIPVAPAPTGDMLRLQTALLNPATAHPISWTERTKERLRQLLA